MQARRTVVSRAYTPKGDRPCAHVELAPCRDVTSSYAAPLYACIATEIVAAVLVLPRLRSVE